MNTGETISKTRNRLSTIATATGSAVIIALSVAFVAVDFNDLIMSSMFTVNNGSIGALEPVRSDPMSEQNAIDSNNGIDDNNLGTEPSNHNTPCLDPNCPICNDDSHHRNPDGTIDYREYDRPPIDISMEDIKFKPNSYEYVDEAIARQVLSEYIESIDAYFSTYPDGRIYLVGCIARTADWSLSETELSKQRADKVRQSLIELGVDGNKLVAIGVGISDPWREDEWANGYFNETVAKNNRRVWIVPDQYEKQVGMIMAVETMLNTIEE